MKDTEKFKISKEKLDSQENVEGIYVSRRQIEGSHRVFVATDSSIISTEINIKLTFQGPVYYLIKQGKKQKRRSYDFLTAWVEPFSKD